jgi:hypothetical protein
MRAGNPIHFHASSPPTLFHLDHHNTRGEVAAAALFHDNENDDADTHDDDVADRYVFLLCLVSQRLSLSLVLLFVFSVHLLLIFNRKSRPSFTGFECKFLPTANRTTYSFHHDSHYRRPRSLDTKRPTAASAPTDSSVILSLPFQRLHTATADIPNCHRPP